jgi:hypothetical protein
MTVILLLLDFSFTKVYENAPPRTKFQYLRSLKDKKVDYLFLGSSRVENAVNAKLIEEKTGKSAANLAFQSSKLSDIYTVLQLIKAYNITVDKIFIQIDYNFNVEDGYSNVFQYELMPFVRENEVTKAYFDRNFKSEKVMYYFPFYRYLKFEPKIGFREFILNISKIKTRIVANHGFEPLSGNAVEQNYSLPSTTNANNIYFEKINAYAKANNMNVVYFCAPFCKYSKNSVFIDQLKQKIPGFYDFSNAIQEETQFLNCTHLNQDGANHFTEIIINKMLSISPQ